MIENFDLFLNTISNSQQLKTNIFLFKLISKLLLKITVHLFPAQVSAYIDTNSLGIWLLSIFSHFSLSIQISDKLTYLSSYKVNYFK